mmetsp:Transcript_2379/g.7291  ORF Transcript_2379/g.7291 Transcript_2379/m.7291 type:complete len:888 (-) Transcript_2379:1150-3813(-)
MADAGKKTNLDQEATPGRNDQEDEGVGAWGDILLVAAVSSLAAVATFENALDADFVFDDNGAIVENEDVVSRGSIGDKVSNMFQHDFWGRPMPVSAHKSFRPLTVLTFHLNWLQAGGRLDRRVFHGTNILLHALNTSLLVVVAALWVFPRSSGKLPLLAVGTLFATHPVHCEAVVGLVGRADLLSALFYLLSLLLYFPASVSGHVGRGRAAGCFILALAMVALSLLCKETGITALAVLGSLDAVRNRVTLLPYPTLKDSGPGKEPGRRCAGWYMLRLSILTAFGSLLLLLRIRIMHGSPTFTAENNPAAFVEEALYRWLSYWQYYVVNARLLLFPRWLCCDWSMGCIRTVKDLRDPRNVYSLALLLFIATLLAFTTRACLCSFKTASQRTVTSSIVLLIVPFIPASNLFFTVGFAVAERIMYLPSAGFCCLAAALLTPSSPALGRQVAISLLGLVGSAMAYAARARNLDWMSSDRIFESGIRVCPDNAKLHYNLAHVTCKGVAEGSKKASEYERCRSLYEKAVSLAPNFGEALGSLATFYEETDVKKSVEFLQQAVKVNPYSKRAHKNLGDLLARKELSIQGAIVHYENAIRIDPQYADAYNNLGNTLLALGDMERVERHYRIALLLDPSHPNARLNIETFFSQKASSKKAKQVEVIRVEEKNGRSIDNLPTEPPDWTKRGWGQEKQPHMKQETPSTAAEKKQKGEARGGDQGSKKGGRKEDENGGRRGRDNEGGKGVNEGRGKGGQKEEASSESLSKPQVQTKPPQGQEGKGAEVFHTSFMPVLDAPCAATRERESGQGEEVQGDEVLEGGRLSRSDPRGGGEAKHAETVLQQPRRHRLPQGDAGGERRGVQEDQEGGCGAPAGCCKPLSRLGGSQAQLGVCREPQ